MSSGSNALGGKVWKFGDNINTDLMLPGPWLYRSAEEQAKVDVTRMQAKIGELALANDFLETALVKAGLLSAKR